MKTRFEIERKIAESKSEQAKQYHRDELALFDVRHYRELLKEIYDLAGGAWGDPVISEDLYNRIEKAISFNCA